MDLRLPGQPGESQDRQSCVERLYPHSLQKKRKEERERKKKEKSSMEPGLAINQRNWE